MKSQNNPTEQRNELIDTTTKVLVEALSLIANACRDGDELLTGENSHEVLVAGYNVKFSTKFIGHAVTLWRERQNALPGGVDPRQALSDMLIPFISTATRIASVLFEAICIHFGIPWETFRKSQGDSAKHKDAVVATVAMYVPLAFDGSWVKFVKYQTNYLFCHYETDPHLLADYGRVHLELPERPECIYHDDGVLAIGRIQRIYFRREVGGDSSVRRAWRWTILQGLKKGMPAVDRSFVIESARGHAKRLSKVEETPEELLQAVKRTASEMFGKVTEQDWMERSLFSNISTNACDENGRGGFGPLGMAERLAASVSGEGTTDDELKAKDIAYKFLVQSVLPGELVEMHYHPATGAVLEVRCPDDPWQDYWHDVTRAAFKKMFDKTEARSGVRFILEPLKVRTITKGPWLDNGIWNGIQKKLWKNMQDFKCFRLTGETVTSEIIEDLRFDCKYNNPTTVAFKYWVSGDYSAATDNLHMDCSAAVIEAIAGDEMTSEIMRRSMLNNTIHYTKAFDGIDDSEFPPEFVATNGQLMGSILSFPILCCINAAVYRYSLEQRTGRRYKLRDLPCLVNGDDILFRADASLIEIWESCIKHVGFEKSLGKNFVSTRFCTVNSVQFHETHCRVWLDQFRTDRPTEVSIKKMQIVPYTNMGFVFGVKKGEPEVQRVATRKGKVEHKPTEACISSLRGALAEYYATNYRPDIRGKMFEQAMWRHRKQDIIDAKLPIRGSKASFGLGFRHLAPFRDDEKYRHYLMEQYRARPMRGNAEMPKSMAPWKMISTIEDQYPDVPTFWFSTVVQKQIDLLKDQINAGGTPKISLADCSKMQRTMAKLRDESQVDSIFAEFRRLRKNLAKEGKHIPMGRMRRPRSSNVAPVVTDDKKPSTPFTLMEGLEVKSHFKLIMKHYDDMDWCWTPSRIKYFTRLAEQREVRFSNSR